MPKVNLLLTLLLFNSTILFPHSSTLEDIKHAKNHYTDRKTVFRENITQCHNESDVTKVATEHITRYLLTLSDDEITNILNTLCYHAQKRNLNQNCILQQLQECMTQKIAYHSHRIYHYDYKEIAMKSVLCTIALAFCSIITGITYTFYKKYHKQSTIEYNELSKDLEKIGVTISERSVNYGKELVTYIDITAAENLSSEQLEYTRNCQKKLVDLYNTKEWAIQAEIFGGVLALFSWPSAIGICIASLFPEHKKRYEKFLHIQEKIDYTLHNAA